MDWKGKIGKGKGERKKEKLCRIAKALIVTFRSKDQGLLLLFGRNVELAVAAVPIDERFFVHAWHFGGDGTADVDDVGASGMICVDFTVEPSECVLQDWCAGFGRAPCSFRESVFVFDPSESV